MARRIITARQQYALLSPWRTAAAEDDLPPNQWSQERRDAHEREYMKKLEQDRLDRRDNATKIYRGLRLDLPPELEDFVYEHYRKDVPYSYDEIGGHLVIGPKLLDHLQKSHPNLLNYGNGYGFDGDDKLGLGRHWTVHRQFAEKAAMQGGRGRHQIVIEADRPGPEHRDPNRTGVGDWSSKGESWKEEEEDTLLPGTPLNVTGVKLNGKEVLHDLRLEERMPKDYDVPLVYPGGPRQQTAALQQRPSRPGDTPPPDYRDLWQRPHGLDADFDPFADLDFDEGRYAGLRIVTAVDFNRYTGYPHIAHVHLPTDVAHYYRFNDGIDGTERDDKYRAAGLPTLTESIAADGIQRPIEINTNGKYASIMDGHHRLGTARRLGLETVPVIINYDPAADGPALKPVEEHLRRILADNPGPYRIAARRPTYGPDRLMGVNINDTLQDFTGQILSGEKTVETRNTKSLHPYVGRRIGILSTHDTRSNPRVTYLVGFATVGEPKFYDNTADFDADYDLHRVAPGSAFHVDHPNCKHGVKWGYPMHDVKRVDPVVVDSTGIVTRDLTEHMHLAGWYHTSPRRLPVGTDLTPGGGRSSYDPFYRAVGEPDRRNHVWVEDDPRLLKRWHDIDADTNYHYRVEPDGEPRPYRDGDTSQGYVVPRARIVEDLGPAKRRRKGHKEDMLWTL